MIEWGTEEPKLGVCTLRAAIYIYRRHNPGVDLTDEQIIDRLAGNPNVTFLPDGLVVLSAKED